MDIFFHPKEKKLYGMADDTKQDSSFALSNDTFVGRKGLAWHVSLAQNT
jgi:hypothetical protein